MFKIEVNEDISLELLDLHHAQDIFDCCSSQREYLGKFLPWVPYIKELQDTKNHIIQQKKNWAENKSFDCAIVYQGKVCGIIGVHEIPKAHGTASIGYWLSEDFRGKHIVTPSVHKLIEVLFHYYSCHRIVIRCATDNEHSQKIAERLGFQKEGILRGAEYINGAHKDHFIFSLLKTDNQ